MRDYACDALVKNSYGRSKDQQVLNFSGEGLLPFFVRNPLVRWLGSFLSDRDIEAGSTSNIIDY
jgi:hypothetical protein